VQKWVRTAESTNREEGRNGPGLQKARIKKGVENGQACRKQE
jgi:hypothetical protein